MGTRVGKHMGGPVESVGGREDTGRGRVRRLVNEEGRAESVQGPP